MWHNHQFQTEEEAEKAYFMTWRGKLEFAFYYQGGVWDKTCQKIKNLRERARAAVSGRHRHASMGDDTDIPF